MTENELLTRISEVQFVCVELNLYLDTHPQDADARSDYYSYSKLLGDLIAEYENEYGPLMGFGHSPVSNGCWVCSDWPWEKE
ncbi:MAG: spore coat protein CotJB [Clostridia bacterium]|nr:spore coat protein CotJB [Clostridia bacterium]